MKRKLKPDQAYKVSNFALKEASNPMARAKNGASLTGIEKKGQPVTGKLNKTKMIAGHRYGPGARTSLLMKITVAMNQITEVPARAMKSNFKLHL
ncbi:MAG: hypothetical protein Kow0029_04890 [Candidatus Rifleibacteriota bacterium]